VLFAIVSLLGAAVGVANSQSSDAFAGLLFGVESVIFLPIFLRDSVVDQTGEMPYTRPMVTIQLTCRHCGSENIVRNGMTSNAKQRFLCKDCGKRSRQNPQPNGYTEEEREEILRAYQERSSLRGLARTFGVSRNTVSGWLKKRQQPSRS
jgi:transposase-like protein